MDTVHRRARWMSGALMVVLMVGGASVASAQALIITKGVGMAAGDDLLLPFTFVVASDGNLWLNTFDSGVCAGVQGPWCNMGTPPGVSLDVPVGVTLYGGASGVEAFVTGSDGNLWCRAWYEGNWYWINTGRPNDGATVTMGVGATESSAGAPIAFALGSDGNLWYVYGTGNTWTWSNQGRPTDGANILSSAGVTVNGSGHAFAFMVGSDGNLWENYYTGAVWLWSNLGQPASGVTATQGFGTSGAATLSGNPETAVVGSDGHVYFYAYSYGNGVWDGPLTTPLVTKPVGLAVGGGVMSIYYFTGSGASVLYKGPYDNGCIYGSPCQTPEVAIGATAVQGLSYAGVSDSSGRLWLNDSQKDKQTGRDTWWAEGAP